MSSLRALDFGPGIGVETDGAEGSDVAIEVNVRIEHLDPTENLAAESILTN